MNREEIGAGNKERPEGPKFFSPCREAWVGKWKNPEPRKGRHSFEDPLRVVIHAGALQQVEKFFFEAAPLMMLTLIANVTLYRPNLRWGDTEGAIPSLPGEIFDALLLQPWRGVRFEDAERVSQTDRWRQADTKVYMVFNAADGDYGNVFVATDADVVSPELLEKIGRNGISTVPSRVNTVQQILRIGMGHRNAARRGGLANSTSPITHASRHGLKNTGPSGLWSP